MNANKIPTAADLELNNRAAELVRRRLKSYSPDGAPVNLTMFTAKLIDDSYGRVIKVRLEDTLLYITAEIGPYNQHVDIAPGHLAEWPKTAINILYQLG